MKRCSPLLALWLIACDHEDWVLPENPNPSKILDEARADATAGRYKNALAKLVWFHRNALKYQPALYGVRLSFALGDWVALGKSYPPALMKLKATRDEAGQNAREGNTPRESFNDFAAINDEVKEEKKTKELFVWLDSNKPDVAKQVYDLAQPALVKAKEYRLCGKYIDPATSFQTILKRYQHNKQYARAPQFRMQKLPEEMFSHSTTTLVALLVLNDRKEDAERIAAEALKEWADPQFKKQLEDAKNGNVPPPWP